MLGCFTYTSLRLCLLYSPALHHPPPLTLNQPVSACHRDEMNMHHIKIRAISALFAIARPMWELLPWWQAYSKKKKKLQTLIKPIWRIWTLEQNHSGFDLLRRGYIWLWFRRSQVVLLLKTTKPTFTDALQVSAHLSHDCWWSCPTAAQVQPYISKLFKPKVLKFLSLWCMWRKVMYRLVDRDRQALIHHYVQNNTRTLKSSGCYRTLYKAKI